jgi:hypothetical protein
MTTAAAIEKFLAKYKPEIASQLRAARKHLAGHFPRGVELVYDNYNALVFAFSASEKAGDAILSIAGYPKWVTLFFAKGTELEDPHRVLEGSGKQFRSVRLQPLERLYEPAVQKLIAAARSLSGQQLEAAPRLTTVVKSVSTKQRPRKPAAKKAAGAVKRRKGR